MKRLTNQHVLQVMQYCNPNLKVPYRFKILVPLSSSSDIGTSSPLLVLIDVEAR